MSQWLNLLQATSKGGNTGGGDLSGTDRWMFTAQRALTVTDVGAVIKGTTPSVTWAVVHGTSYTGRTTIASSVTTAIESVSPSSAAVPAGNHVFITVSASSGTVDDFGVQVNFTEDGEAAT